MSKHQLNQSSCNFSFNVEIGECSQAALKHINDILMEEDPEDDTCMLPDHLALQATEKSLRDALGQNRPLSLDPSPPGGSSYVSEEDVVEESKLLDIIYDSFIRMVTSSHDESPTYICPLFDASRLDASKNLQQNEQRLPSRIMELNGEMVDFMTLLIQCAEVVSIGNTERANQLLKQIRKYSSPFGDGNQRLAHYFANGLESRLAGTENITCVPTVGSSTRAVDILKAYKMYNSICPFRKISNIFTAITIVELAPKATKIHIIDFGIDYGFKWLCFLQFMSERTGGPPKIRITGIDLPQPGTRPAERVEETGNRLKRLAESLNLEFEYRAIAQRMESIQYEGLEIDRDAIIVVTCMYRLKNLPDDTISPNSPRDTVLTLIKRINPDVFIHGVTNGTYNAPFFTTRFREALFYYSTLFDILETNVPREDPERQVFEREMIGKAAMNVIACEGAVRVERPETYKQWQARTTRIGFRQLPLSQDVMKRVRIVKLDCHESFVVDEDGEWVLLGWKGGIVHAISAWKPVQH